MKLKKIISGGQTGADLGGLHAAKILGLETGGFIPKGFLTEDGPNPSLAEFGIVETSSKDYPIRTKMNVQYADATIIFSPSFSRGSALTEKLAKASGKPYLLIKDLNSESDCVTKVFEFLVKHSPTTINIAGNRESKSPGIQKKVIKILTVSFYLIDGPEKVIPPLSE
jgi:hypothetical protein